MNEDVFVYRASRGSLPSSSISEEQTLHAYRESRVLLTQEDKSSFLNGWHIKDPSQNSQFEVFYGQHFSKDTHVAEPPMPTNYKMIAQNWFEKARPMIDPGVVKKQVDESESNLN